MNTEELSEKYKKFAEPGGPLHGLFTVRSVDHGNYKVDGLAGHPFTIGSEHVAYASDHCGGILGQEVLERLPCAAQLGTSAHGRFGAKCGRPLSAHTSDKILFVSLVRNLGNKEAANALFAIEPEMLADKIDGVAFVDTTEKFRIAKPEPDQMKEGAPDGDNPT